MRVAIVAMLVAATGVARADGPQTEDQQRADVLFAAGRKLIEAHDDAGACKKFNEAIRLDPEAAGTMLNLGLCNENLKKYGTALDWFRKAQQRAQKSALPDYERAAGVHIAQLASLVASVKIAFAGTSPADAKVRIDGEELKARDYDDLEIDTGHHVLEAGAPGYRTVRQEFDVVGKGGQTLTIELVVGDSSVIVDRGAGRRKAALLTAIGGGALLVTGSIVALYAKNKYGDCVTGEVPPPTCSGEDGTMYANHYARLARYAGTALFVGAGLGIGVAAYLYFTAPQRERIDRTVWVPALGPDQIGFAAAGVF